MIRIIAGRFKGRRLAAPVGTGTRPTGDRARTALFDMLAHARFAGPAALEGASVLDAFAGTGALGIEALSRGAARALFIEHDGAVRAVLRRNLQGLAAEAEVLAADATDPPPAVFAASLVFLDPPYGRGLAAAALAALAARGWLAEGALVVVETGRAEALEVAGFTLLDDRAHGRARLRTLRFRAGAPGDWEGISDGSGASR